MMVEYARYTLILMALGVGIWGCSTPGGEHPTENIDGEAETIDVEGAPKNNDAREISTHEDIQAQLPAEDAGKLSPAGETELMRLLEELTDALGGSGGSLSVVVGEKERTFVHGVRVDGGPDVEPATYFNIASVSKSLSAARIISLAAEVRLDLDESLQTYLPGVSLLDPAGADVSEDISVRDLLGHRSGLPHQPGDQVDPAVFGNNWADPKLLEKLTADWQIQLSHRPGSYHYSNMGYVLLGAIAEQVQGCEFAKCMADYFDSIGLKHTTFLVSEAREQAAHGRVITEGRADFHPPEWYASTYALPFNGAWVTTPDLAAFGRELIGATDAPDSPLHTMIKRASQDDSAGLGIMHGSYQGHATLEHDGSGPGFHARLVVLPEYNIVLAVAINGGTESRAQAQDLTRLTNEMLSILAPSPD